MRWNVIGYILIFGAGTKFFATMFSMLAYNYVALSVLKIQPTFFGSLLFLIYGWCFAGFEVWLGIKIIQEKNQGSEKK